MEGAAAMQTCLVCFSKVVSLSTAAWRSVWGIGSQSSLVHAHTFEHQDWRTFPIFSASGICLSASLEKSFSGLIAASDIVKGEIWREKAAREERSK
jgi:hypothetical protein